MLIESAIIAKRKYGGVKHGHQEEKYIDLMLKE
jgi:hypothetical protein